MSNVVCPWVVMSLTFSITVRQIPVLIVRNDNTFKIQIVMYHINHFWSKLIQKQLRYNNLKKVNSKWRLKDLVTLSRHNRCPWVVMGDLESSCFILRAPLSRQSIIVVYLSLYFRVDVIYLLGFFFLLRGNLGFV